MMPRKIWLAAVLLASAAGHAAAQDAAKAAPFRAADYPVEVRKSLSEAVLVCRQYENGKIEFAPDTVRKVDLNGDGRDDYVISFADTGCTSQPSVFCGTGGCGTDFLVALPNGKLRRLFAETIHKYEILPGRPRKVRFWIHHSYCDGNASEGCFKDHRITYKPFTTRR